MKFKFCITSLVFFLFQFSTSAATTTTFDKAVEAYTQGKYDTTVVIIRNFLRKNGKDPESERLVPLIAEALIRKGDTESSHRLISMFKQKYPSSPFIARLWYLDGIAYAKEEKFLKALNAFSAALDAGVSRTLDSLIMANTDLISTTMCVDEFSAVPSKYLHSRIAEIVRFYEISKLYTIGEFSKAQNVADQFRKTYSRSRYDQKVKDFFSKSKDKEKSSINIGILSPVSGEDGEIGRKIVMGSQLAIEQFNSQKGKPVKMLVFDTKGSMIETVRKTQELLEQHHVPIIIGPMLSHTATVCASMVMGKPVVMISPTATDDGIADLGKNIFQMNTTLGVLARKIASYAVENLNIREFAVLAPESPYGKLMAENFINELHRRNIEVVAEQYFNEGGNDFTSQFADLRSKLLSQYLEELMLKTIDLKRKVVKRDSLRYADSTLAVEGLFIPADADDIVMVAPQVFFHRIRTQILGANGWHNQKVIDDGNRYVANAMFSTSFETDQTQKNWFEFKKAFKSRFNSDPDKISALGYDAASLVLNAIEFVGDDPQRIADALSKVKGYKGLSSTISFDTESGANSEAVIMKVTKTGFVRVQ